MEDEAREVGVLQPEAAEAEVEVEERVGEHDEDGNEEEDGCDDADGDAG